RLYLHEQAHVVREAEVQPPVDAPQAAFDGRLEIAAADLALEDRVLVAVEALRLQRHRMRLAAQRELPGERADLVAVEFELVGDESARRELVREEEVASAQMRIERWHPGLRRRRVGGDVGLAVLRGAVDLHRALL